jgi:hypothetical protein
MITVIAEHSVDLSQLPKKANILDLGCRGFLFAAELVRLGHNVFPVDIGVLENVPMNYYRFGIGQFDGQCDILHSKDPQGTRMTPGFGIPMFTLKSFSKHVDVDFWDLIKIDIEGSEYEVIMSLNEPPAKQLSIEFHLHTGIYGIQQMAEMRDKLTSLGYEAVSHEMTKQHGLGLNFWDSLFILK